MSRKHRPVSRAAGVGALAALALCLLTTMLAGPALGSDSATAAARKKDEIPVVGDLTFVHANILTRLKTAAFQKDVATVIGLQPDFISYNEVPFRTDPVMAPTGYSIYRNMRNRFTAATPVAWRSDRWTAIDTGVWRVSNWRGKPPGRVVELGRRFANWATLQDAEGRVVSIVSVHVAPTTKGMPDLLRRSVNRVGKLVDRLAGQGPVLVAGDFNVHYKSGRYPRDLFDAYGMVPSFDALGTYFPTGDHFGNTIDFVFTRGIDALAPQSHYPVELRSDHDAVVVDMSWTTDPPSQIQMVRNQPDATTVADRRTALRTLLLAIHNAEPGSRIVLAARAIDRGNVVKRVRQALARGVQVAVYISGQTPTKQETKIARAIASVGDASSTFSRCVPGCGRTWSELDIPATLLMVSDSAGAWTARYDANRKLTAAMVEKRSRVTVQTGPIALETGAGLVQLLG